MVGSDRQSVARQTERLALEYLEQRGLKLLARNFRCRHGEIDLVMRDDSTIVFVEVRFRKPNQFAAAAASVDFRKQRKLCLAGGFYLRKHPCYHSAPVRFDVVAFDGMSGEQFTLQWLQDAFRPGGWAC